MTHTSQTPKAGHALNQIFCYGLYVGAACHPQLRVTGAVNQKLTKFSGRTDTVSRVCTVFSCKRQRCMDVGAALTNGPLAFISHARLLVPFHRTQVFI